MYWVYYYDTCLFFPYVNYTVRFTPEVVVRFSSEAFFSEKMFGLVVAFEGGGGG